MNPTTQLRFVERIVPDRDCGDGVWSCSKKTILQQLWAESYQSIDESGNAYTATEWRDVPVEAEK